MSSEELIKSMTESFCGDEKPVDEKGIIEEKYMIIIKRYPNGTVFPTIFKMGRKNVVPKKRKPKKELTQTKIQKKEEY